MIPKKIHQLWIAPAEMRGGMPDDLAAQTRRWRDTHPDFDYRLWTLDEVAASLPPEKAQRMMAAVAVCRFEAMRADVARLYLVSEFGGFWSDLKVYPKRRWLDEHLEDDLMLVEHFASEFIPNPRGVLLNSLFGAAPGDPFIAACLDRAHHNIDRRLSSTLWNVASPQMYMDVFDDWVARTGAPPPGIVLPSAHVWGAVVDTGAGGFSAGDRHWSVREQHEPMYLDTDNRADAVPSWRYKFLTR